MPNLLSTNERRRCGRDFASGRSAAPASGQRPVLPQVPYVFSFLPVFSACSIHPPPCPDGSCRYYPRSPNPWDLVALGVACSPVADVEQDGEDHPEPVEAHEADTWRVDDHVDEGREREEDDAQERQEEGIERRADEGRSGDPHYEQRDTRE